MNSKDRTLVALEKYIDSQRNFLKQTHNDIERLKQLRKRALENPLIIADNLTAELDDDAFRLSHSREYIDSARRLPNLIEWEVLQSKDPDPLKLTDLKLNCKPKDHPSKLKNQPPSDLQKYVHESACNLLSKLSPLSPSPTPPPCPPPNMKPQLSPLSAKLDPRNIKTSSQIENGLRRTSRVHKPKYNKEDQGLEEIILSPTQKKRGRRNTIRAASTSTRSTRQTMSPTVSRASQAPSETTMGCSHSVENGEKLKIRIPPMRELPIAAEVPPTLQPEPRRRGDVNSVTFNLQWSTEEQHLLEKLLIEIPKGERNRWARISKGMGGRRSARQVASRVQKYFEKLDRMGIPHAG